MATKVDVDVAIIGGGPAGSATAGYLAKAGVSCVVLEREEFPRPHVGESLVPSTTRIFKDLGFLEQMERHKFPRKYGAAWTTSDGPQDYSHDWEGVRPEDQVDIQFAERAQEGVDQVYTYHVDRGKFDHLLLEHAAKLGADVRERSPVSRVLFDGPSGVTVQFREDGKEQELRAKLVVDASGRRTLLGNQLKLRVTDPVFDQYALHTWFEGFDRGSDEKADYIWIHFLPITNSWIWQIPITEEITSVGVVTQKANFSAAKESLEEFFWDSVRRRPDLHEKLLESKQLRPLKPEGDYSYAMSELAGDRFVLVGDAARFVDPIFSSGVSIALASAKFASTDILGALERDDFTPASFEAYTSKLRNGCRHWYEFIRLYYRLNLLFTYFVGHPDHRLDVLRLLQGDVYDEAEPAVLTEMREMVEQVENNPDHIFHDLLGTLTADAFRPGF